MIGKLTKASSRLAWRGVQSEYDVDGYS